MDKMSAVPHAVIGDGESIFRVKDGNYRTHCRWWVPNLSFVSMLLITARVHLAAGGGQVRTLSTGSTDLYFSAANQSGLLRRDAGRITGAVNTASAPRR